MDAFNNYLKQFPNYKPSVLENILPHLTIKTIKAGDYFLREGKICKSIAYVEVGLFRLFYINDGKEITDCFCRENTVIASYKSLITQTESEIVIQAIEDAKLNVLSYDAIQKLYDKDVFWQQVGRLSAENEFIRTECHNRFLTDLSATEKYLQLLETDYELLQRVPLRYLASYFQIAPETLSRIRKKISGT